MDLNNINGGTIFIDGDCFVVDYGFVYHYCIIPILAEMASSIKCGSGAGTWCAQITNMSAFQAEYMFSAL